VVQHELGNKNHATICALSSSCLSAQVSARSSSSFALASSTATPPVFPLLCAELAALAARACPALPGADADHQMWGRRTPCGRPTLHSLASQKNVFTLRGKNSTAARRRLKNLPTCRNSPKTALGTCQIAEEAPAWGLEEQRQAELQGGAAGLGRMARPPASGAKG